jgi:predicted enzyme related to lactoylglutathione lyase
MTGEVGHFEIPADRPDRARKFYEKTFGWKMNVMEGMEYTMVSTGPVDEQGTPKAPGFIGGGIGKRADNLQHPVVTIMVDEITDALKAVEQNGGKVLQAKKPVGDGSMGWTAYFKDSEGNTVGLYQWPPNRPQ